jgi:hypothetical protein
MTLAAFYRSRRPMRWAVVAALAVAVSTVIAPPSHKAYAAPGWQKLTQAELTVVWWQWLYSIPASENPLLDDTGADAYNGQPYSDLLFLAGSASGTVTRNISVKQGTALFFPLVNIEWDNECGRPNLGGNCPFGTPKSKYPQNLGVPKLQAFATATMDSATGLYSMLSPADQSCSQTGTSVNVGYTRLPSHPFPYTLPPPPDNLYGDLNIRGPVAPAVGDGFYSLIPGTLAQGDYMLKFGGAAIYLGGTFTQDITYCITVTP